MDEAGGPDTVSVVGVRVLARYILELTFNTGEVRVLDFERLMWDPSFESLLADYRLFCEVGVDPGSGTLTWPDVGPDWTSEELYRKSKPAVPRASQRDETQKGRPRVDD